MSSVEPPPGFRTLGDKPSGTRLLLIRHGEAHCNARGVVGGPLGCGGLTDLGRRQCVALRDRLVFSGELAHAAAIYTSVLPRAIETAAILGPGLPARAPIEDCELCELHPGEADGLTWQEMIDRFGAPDWDKDPAQSFAPGGESWIEFYERCANALMRIAASHAGELVVLVVHGGVIEQAMKMVLGRSPGDRLRLRTENASMTEIEFEVQRLRLLRYNDRAPLAAE